MTVEKDEFGHDIINRDVMCRAGTVELDYGRYKVRGFFNCSHIAVLESLRGCPIEVGEYFSCTHTNIKSLEGCPRRVAQSFHCEDTPHLHSLQNIHKYVEWIGGGLHISYAIKSHVLGVLLIKGVRSVTTQFRDFKHSKAVEILNIHLRGEPNPMRRNIHLAQIQLLEAGLEDYAQL